jgi:hypothetical protein
MGDVIPIRPANPGNGAREALVRYFGSLDFFNYKLNGGEMNEADHLLAWLWNEGFIVEKLK